MNSSASKRGLKPRRVSTPPPLFLHGGPADEPAPIARAYDAAFVVTPEYRATLPDLMLAAKAIQGANVPVQQVGVSNFKLPLRFCDGAKGEVTLEASVLGTVSLQANVKGINMSRIVRSFYEHQNERFSPELLRTILQRYRRQVGASAANLRVSFSYPILQHSLRSRLAGYQYYEAVFEGRMDADGRFRRFIEFVFIYSSACPCSAELSEHARTTREVFAIPHSQRSRARIRLEIATGKKLSIQDVHAHCLRALQTETQVMVKREDEQAFAELNGAHLKFVEDAARLLYRSFAADRRIHDFQVVCVHEESLHSHDAISVICKGLRDGMMANFDGLKI